MAEDPASPPPDVLRQGSIFAARLAAVRSELAMQGLEGVVLKRTDAHGSEYLPACEERIAWLTGFTGSAGEVAILKDKAAIFVDGRYVEQLAKETDATLFEHRHVTETPLMPWLEENLKPAMRLGYDAKRFRRADKRRLESLGPRCGVALAPVERNPIDAVWEDRPPPPQAPVFRHPLRYAGERSADKRRRMGEAIAGKGAQWLVVTAADIVAWLLNIRGGDIPFNPVALSFLLLEPDGACRWFIDKKKLPEGFDVGDGVEVEAYEGFEPALRALGQSASKVLVDPQVTHEGFLASLEDAGAVLIEAEDPCRHAKARKNEKEVAGAIAAQRRDGAALVRFLARIARTLPATEIEAAQWLEAERAKDPLFRGPSFETIAAHGPNAALPHYRADSASARAIEPDTLLLVDSGAQYPDATTDITRTVLLGKASPQMRTCFTLVLKGHIALAEAVFPKGTTGQQLDVLARQALWRHGLDYDHGTGHGIGSYLSVHEGPASISKRAAEVPLEPGMILSNEPGYYRPGEWGIRIENLVLVRELERPEGGERDLLGFRTLSFAPVDRRLIEPALLSEAERFWLNDYHAQVEEELGPLLTAAERAWLEESCRPI